MRVVALISGGKDSCYNMVQCVAAGHDVVALANLRPESQDELDSYMYQTVGHQGVELYAEAMGLPLFRQMTHGVALLHDKVYTPTPEDEVEDLYRLLNRVKEEINIEAVAVGAVLSDYQRVRVENVCSRLGLIALAYLWRRDQAELLQEMIDCNIDAVIIKVAALGLDPVKHLGLRISEIQPHLVKMNEKYGLNVCGEGGEYETFTLDSPLFAKSVVIEDFETVIHSNDAIAPVGYLNFRKFRLIEKENGLSEINLHERLVRSGCVVKNALDYISDIDCADNILCDDSDTLVITATASTPSDSGDNVHKEENSNNDNTEIDSTDEQKQSPSPPELQLVLWEEEPAAFNSVVHCNTSGWAWFGSVTATHDNVATATKLALNKLSALVKCEHFMLGDLVAVCLYVRDISDYTQINNEYIRVLSGHNPPVRVCVEAPLSPQTPVIIEAVAYSQPEKSNSPSRHTMHVQGVSHWAPANIGPYSQAVQIGEVIYVAGQIGLVPGSMTLVEGGVLRQCKLSLRHISRIIKAMDPNSELRNVVQSVCYVTNAAYIPEVRSEWEKHTNNSIVDYVVVPRLPRDSFVEWHVWVHKGNSRFEYEETGCVVGDNRVSICRRWNYENTVSAIVCYVSASSSVSNPTMCEGNNTSVATSCDEQLSSTQLDEVLNYVLSRLMKDVSSPYVHSTVCSMRVFYRVGRAPSPAVLHAALSRVDTFTVVPTVVPVSQLNHPNTFLSLCALRHL
ncbi:uncharacterized protein LOC142331244 isoform X2 [Lycorma delicatula]|uniref:uncharacterized protein LOC142331244 isoform X2 n=1 Tax=Lycorma delicatula TaxID=130591 RepID=UPI003F51624E